jgi:hypothetical protein
MRRAIVPLAQKDGTVIAGAVREVARPYRQSVDSYF